MALVRMIVVAIALSVSIARAQKAPAVRNAPPEPATTATAAPASIAVSFKLDPRLTRSLYMGDRWVSPPTYTSLQDGKAFFVEARGYGRDPRGKPMRIRPTWTSSDPEMVTVTPSEGYEVTIAVHRAGDGRVHVTAQGVSRILTVEATSQNSILRVTISQQ